MKAKIQNTEYRMHSERMYDSQEGRHAHYDEAYHYTTLYNVLCSHTLQTINHVNNII